MTLKPHERCFEIAHMDVTDIEKFSGASGREFFVGKMPDGGAVAFSNESPYFFLLERTRAEAHSQGQIALKEYESMTRNGADNPEVMSMVELQVRRAAEAIFSLQVIGRSRATSEFGLPYTAYSNGFITQEGASTLPVVGWDDVVNTCVSLFRAEVAGGNNVIVWRATPEAHVFGGKHKLWMRCHFMSMAALREWEPEEPDQTLTAGALE